MHMRKFWICPQRSLMHRARGGFAKEQAFDGNNGTRWASSSKPAWIWVDLGGNRFIYGVTVRWETACAQDYELYVLRKQNKSAAGFDGKVGDTVTLTSWTSVASVTGGNGGTDTFDFTNQTFSSGGTASVSPTPIANYLLLNGTSTLVYGGISTWEITVDASEIRDISTVIMIR